MEDIEGDWKGFTFSIATESMTAEIEQLVLSSYHADEPLTQRFGYTEDYGQEAAHLWKSHLKDGLGLAVFHKDTDKLVAVRLSCESKKDDNTPIVHSHGLKKIFQLIAILDAQSDVCNKYQVDRCSSSLLATVHKDFRGRGIASELYRRSIKLCRVLGYKVIQVTFTSPWSRKGAENAGFKEVAYLDYHNLKNEDGTKFLESSEPGDIITQSVYIIED